MVEHFSSFFFFGDEGSVRSYTVLGVFLWVRVEWIILSLLGLVAEYSSL